MIQLIGILVVLNTLVSAIWWTAKHRAWSAGMAVFTGLGLSVGLTMALHQHLLELAPADMGALSAAAGSAQKEAAAVIALREKFESGVTMAFHQHLLELARADMGALSAAAGTAQKEAAAVIALREKFESEIGEIKRLAGQSASTAPVENVAPAPAAEATPEVAELREKLAASAAEIERLGKQLEKARPRVAETGAASPAPTPEALQAAAEQARILPKSGEILPPPQARSRTGETAGEQAALLKQRFEEAIDRHKEGQHQLAYVAAQACVELYESSRDAGQKDGPDLGGVTTDGAAAIYSVAAEICQRVVQHERALEWARRAVELHPSPERKALLATTYLNLKRREEADKIIEEANSGSDPASLELRKLLTDFGIIKAARK